MIKKTVSALLLIAVSANTLAFADGSLTAPIRNKLPSELVLGRDVLLSTGAGLSFLIATTTPEAYLFATSTTGALILTAMAIEEYVERKAQAGEGAQQSPVQSTVKLREQLTLVKGDAKTYLTTGEMSENLRDTLQLIREVNRSVGNLQVDNITDAEFAESISTMNL